MQETEGNIQVQLEALSVAFMYPALSTHPQVLCAAARACKDWRQAVQQCSACNTAVVVDAAAPLPLLDSFATWLPRHARLLNSITLKRNRQQYWYGDMASFR
jgi:hypothetical protein